MFKMCGFQGVFKRNRETFKQERCWINITTNNEHLLCIPKAETLTTEIHIKQLPFIPDCGSLNKIKSNKRE
jgi:hypothetical protein